MGSPIETLRIVSGGQTGVDRAALDVALERGLPCGGWCPCGRLAEDGPIPGRYPLLETPSAGYPLRTEWNVRDSDATLILTRGKPSGGTALTIDLVNRYAKPLQIIDLSLGQGTESAREWLRIATPHTLNIAGPRESQQPGIYEQALEFLQDLFVEVDPT